MTEAERNLLITVAKVLLSEVVVNKRRRFKAKQRRRSIRQLKRVLRMYAEQQRSGLGWADHYAIYGWAVDCDARASANA